MKNFALFILLFETLTVFEACKQKKVVESYSKFRFVNVSPNAGYANVYMDEGRMYVNDLEYLNYSLFSKHISTKHNLKFVNMAGTLVADTNLQMLENKNYSAILYDSNSITKVMIYEDDLTTPVGSFCKLRFIHLSNNAPASDIRQKTDTTLLFGNYHNGMRSPYRDFPVDSTLFTANYIGATTPYYTQFWKEGFVSGNLYTLIFKGNVGSTGLDSLGFLMIRNNSTYD